jgi:RNA recognition motif-containing protein
MRFTKGYRIINIPLEVDGAAYHSLYVREHADRNNKAGNSKILFVGNIDYMPDITHDEIERFLNKLFSPFGPIKTIHVSDIKEAREDVTARFARIEFEKKSSIKLALNASDMDYSEAGRVLVESASAFNTAPKSLADIRSMFSFVDHDAEDLQEEVDDFMESFEQNELFKKEESNRRLSEADEDGFMPVKNR